MDEPASRSERPRRRYWVPLLAASGLLIVGAAAQRWRACLTRALWLAVYATLCAAAIWSHLTAPHSEVIEVHES